VLCYLLVKEVHGLCVSSMTSVCCVYMCECLVYEIHVVCVYVSVLHSCGALLNVYYICEWCVGEKDYTLRNDNSMSVDKLS